MKKIQRRNYSVTVMRCNSRWAIQFTLILGLSRVKGRLYAAKGTRDDDEANVDA